MGLPTAWAAGGDVDERVSAPLLEAAFIPEEGPGLIPPVELNPVFPEEALSPPKEELNEPDPLSGSSVLVPLAIDLSITISGYENYQYAEQVFDLLNVERRKAGLVTLTYDRDLTTAAMQRAAESAVLFSHTRPTGDAWHTVSGKASGENLAAETASVSTPTSTMTAWMNSSGHKANILLSSYRSVGIGCFIHNNVAYWAQEFSYNNATATPNKANAYTSPYINISLSTCKFPSANVVAPNTVTIGTAASATFMVTNPGWNYSRFIPNAPSVSWSSSSSGVLSVSSTGALNGFYVGTATVTGRFGGVSGTSAAIQVVNPAPVAPKITTEFIPDAIVGIPYSHTLAATGTAPISWSFSAGSAPEGLTLSSSGVISGTPSATGSFSFIIKATNSAGSVTRGLTFKVVERPAPSRLSITYSTHVQNVGWQTPVQEGQVSGTSGRSLRLEGLKVNITNNTGYGGGIKYATHVQNIGWQSTVNITTPGVAVAETAGGLSGTEGLSLRLEAMTLELTGELAKHYDIYYRVHAQDVGWMGWAKNGARAGTAGSSLRLEALQIVLMDKGDPAPADSHNGVKTPTGTPHMIDPLATSNSLGYSAVVHIESIGDKVNNSANGTTQLGTSGQSLRLEALTLNLKSRPYSGGITYETHIQNIGWQGEKAEGEMAGTSGRSLRLEALRIKLTEDMAKHFDVYYRTHIQNIGWTGWAKNGQSCGSAGDSYRMEAIQIVIVPKDGAAPGLTSGHFYQR